jgi:A/G-specific adenine glycosylase
VSSIRSSIQSPKERLATALSAFPTWSEPVGLGAKRTLRIPPAKLPFALVREALLAWFAENGRDLPWRRTRDPYAILVSEVMLQQTQAARVVPRYLEWLERWPTADALAAAPTADVIRAWQGLGYNRRALSLQRAARHVAEHGWPDDLTVLPGVGRYTADAIGCFALARPVLPRDVNVARVLERTHGSFDASCAQALMDLGATVCIARVPRCGICPLASGCRSRGRRFEPARKQGPFEGSFRQRRARTLRTIAEGPRRLSDLDEEAVEALARDELVLVQDELVSLPSAVSSS